jgi:hypothetical protein
MQIIPKGIATSSEKVPDSLNHSFLTTILLPDYWVIKDIINISVNIKDKWRTKKQQIYQIVVFI